MAATFARFGRAYHIRITNGADLRDVLALDDALWVAMGCPVETVRADAAFLAYLDSDANGRIMCYEVRSAIEWLLAVSSDLGPPASAADGFPLTAIRESHPDGRRLLAVARRVAEGKATVTVSAVRSAKAHAEANPVSASGVVLPTAADTPEVATFMEDIVAVTGGSEHPSGRPGVTAESVAVFMQAVGTYLAWLDALDPASLPFAGGRPRSCDDELRRAGDRAYRLFARLEPKIDQFFSLCSAIEIDERIARRVRVGDAELDALDLDDPGALRSVMERSPLAPPEPDAPLPLIHRVNPYFEDDLAAFAAVLAEIPGLELGATRPVERLSYAEWGEVRRHFQPYREWLARRPSGDVAKIPELRLRSYVGSFHQTQVAALIARANEDRVDIDGLRLLEKLLLYRIHLVEFANNFVAFPALYAPDRRALFEMGTLVMDGRRFTLAVRVFDRARHRLVAEASRMFVLYVVVRPRVRAGAAGAAGQSAVAPAGASASAVLYEVAVPVTAGDARNLSIGKRGLFHDVDGTEYDAEVMDIIRNPISVGEAIIAPFKRLGELVTTKVEALTAEARAKLDAEADAVVHSVAGSSLPSPDAGRSTSSSQGGRPTAGLIAGGGVAVAAIGSMFTYIAATIASLSFVDIVVGIGGALAAVIVPMTLLALIKLSKRDLSSILEGSGWAINARMRLTRGQAMVFTHEPRIPRAARRSGRRWGLWVIGVVLVAAVVIVVVRYLLPALPAIPPGEG